MSSNFMNNFKTGVGNLASRTKAAAAATFTTDYSAKFDEKDEVKTVTVKMIGNNSKGYVIDDVNVGDEKTIEPQELANMVGKELVFTDKRKTNRGAIEKALGSSSSKNIDADPQVDTVVDSNADSNSGGYAAMKRSRSVGTKRKTMRQAKRHARRSRRSRLSL